MEIYAFFSCQFKCKPGEPCDTCNCQNGGTCDTNGDCVCKDGYTVRTVNSGRGVNHVIHVTAKMGERVIPMETVSVKMATR